MCEVVEESGALGSKIPHFTRGVQTPRPPARAGGTSHKMRETVEKSGALG